MSESCDTPSLLSRLRNARTASLAELVTMAHEAADMLASAPHSESGRSDHEAVRCAIYSRMSGDTQDRNVRTDLIMREIEPYLAKSAPSAGGDTFAEGAYMEGVRDAATYIGGCTFAEGDIRLVRTVISLLHAFAAQGGYGKWKTVRSAIAPIEALRALIRAVDGMADMDEADGPEFFAAEKALNDAMVTAQDILRRSDSQSVPK